MIVTSRSQGLAVEVGDRHPVRADVGNVALVEEDDPVRVGEDRRHVAGEERLAIRDANDQRHILARADQPVCFAAMHDDERVGALELAQRRTCRLGQIALVGLLDEVRDRLGVGLGRERVAARLERVAQLPEVLDDPVVDDRDLARAVLVGMGVQVVRAPVRGPARVRQPDRGVRRPVGDGRLEIGELAGALLDEEVARVVDERDARRVVAAVLEPLEPFDEDRARLTGTGVSDDATHAVKISVQARESWTPGEVTPLRASPALV